MSVPLVSTDPWRNMHQPQLYMNIEYNIPAVITEGFWKLYTSNTICVILDKSHGKEFILETCG